MTDDQQFDIDQEPYDRDLHGLKSNDGGFTMMGESCGKHDSFGLSPGGECPLCIGEAS